MSMDRCNICTALIDTDLEGDLCYVAGTPLCESCRDEPLDVDAMTLEQCVAETGYRPSPQLSIANEAERAALQLQMARAHVGNCRVRDGGRDSCR